MPQELASCFKCNYGPFSFCSLDQVYESNCWTSTLKNSSCHNWTMNVTLDHASHNLSQSTTAHFLPLLSPHIWAVIRELVTLCSITLVLQLLILHSKACVLLLLSPCPKIPILQLLTLQHGTHVYPGLYSAHKWAVTLDQGWDHYCAWKLKYESHFKCSNAL